MCHVSDGVFTCVLNWHQMFKSVFTPSYSLVISTLGEIWLPMLSIYQDLSAQRNRNDKEPENRVKKTGQNHLKYNTPVSDWIANPVWRKISTLCKGASI